LIVAMFIFSMSSSKIDSCILDSLFKYASKNTNDKNEDFEMIQMIY